MIEYIEIINRIKDIKEEAIISFNENVSIPLTISNLDSVIKQQDNKIIIENENNKIELNIDVRKAFFEVICILKKINSELLKKIDFKYIDFFEKFKFVDNEFVFDYEKFEDIKFSELTLQILTILNIKFWCENDIERKEFLENLKHKPIIKNYEKKEDINVEIEDDVSEEKQENLDIAKDKWWLRFLNKFRKINKN